MSRAPVLVAVALAGCATVAFVDRDVVRRANDDVAVAMPKPRDPSPDWATARDLVIAPIDRVLALSDRITVLHQGRLIADGPPAEVGKNPDVIAAYMGANLSLSDAIKLDALVGARQRLFLDPTEHVEGYLRSQKGGANTEYQRPDA